MHDTPDAELLERFARNDSEQAFAELVSRHIALVHSVAARHTENPQHAQEITQAVFIILSRKAASLGRKTVLSGWLYHTARLTAANFRRAEFRRISREQEAYMQSTLDEHSSDAIWLELAPHLDDAMEKLGATDRDAVVLRYLENKSLAEVGTALGMEERAAQKRVTRALAKLREIFSKRGVSLTATLIASAVAANSVQAAPVGLAAAVTATAAKGTLISATITTLVKGTMKTMTWLKLKFAVGAGVGIIFVAGLATVALPDGNSRSEALNILGRSQARYNALSSYSDTTRTMGLTRSLYTNVVSVLLSRPNSYRIQWPIGPDVGVNKQNHLWSTGDGNFLYKPEGYTWLTNKLFSFKDRTIAMSTVGGISTYVPCGFFEPKFGNVLSFMSSSTDLMKQTDEPVNGVACHVLSGRIVKSIVTIWIGKEDLLIHKLLTVFDIPPRSIVISPQDDQMTVAAKRMILGGQLEQNRTNHVTIEVHENIQVNQPHVETDFIPPIPDGLKPIDWDEATKATRGFK